MSSAAITSVMTRWFCGGREAAGEAGGDGELLEDDGLLLFFRLGGGRLGQGRRGRLRQQQAGNQSSGEEPARGAMRVNGRVHGGCGVG
jgi:hypothetical protein